MKQILCSDWLPKRARRAYLARSGLPALFPQSWCNLFGCIINLLLTKLVGVKIAGYWRRSFLSVFMDLDFASVHKNAEKELGQYPASWTSRFVNTATHMARSFLALLSL